MFDFGGMFKKKSDTKTANSQESKQSFFGGMMNFIFGLGGFKNSKNEDKITAAYKEIEKKRKENAEKRLKELRDSQESAFVAKIKAQAELRERNLSLKNKMKVDAYNSKKARYEADAKQVAKMEHVLSDAEIEAYNKKLDDDLKSLQGTTGYDAMKAFNDLRKIVTITEDGEMRTPQEIEEFLNNNPKIAEDWKSAISENEANMMSCVFDKDGKVKADEISDYLDEINANANAIKELPEKEKEYINKKKEYDKNCDIAKNYKEQQDKLESIDKQLETLKNNKAKMPDWLDGENPLDPTHDDYREKLAIEINKAIDGKNAEEAKKIMKENFGFNDAQIEKIVKLNPDSSQATYGGDNKIELVEDDISKDDLENNHKNLKKKISTKIEEQTILKNNLEKQNKAAEAAKNKIIEDSGFGPKEEFEKEIRNYDPSTPIGKELKTQMDNAEKQIRDFKAEVESAREARKSALATAKADHEENRSKKDDPELYKKADGLALSPGETVKDGKRGYMDENGNFVENNMATATDKERQAYLDGLNKHVESMSDFKANRYKIVKNNDGKYTITDHDGNEVESGCDVEKAAEYQAINSATAQAEEKAKSLRKKTTDVVSKCIVDGEFDPEKFNELKDEEKETVKNFRDQLKSEEGKEKIKDLYKDLDFNNTDFTTLEDELEDFEDGEYEDEDSKDIKDADDIESDYKEEGETDDEAKDRNKNPAKIWKKKKNKHTNKPTKNYYNQDGDSISPKEFKERVANYKKRVAKKNGGGSGEPGGEPGTNESRLLSLKDYLIESFNDNKRVKIVIIKRLFNRIV